MFNFKTFLRICLFISSHFDFKNSKVISKLLLQPTTLSSVPLPNILPPSHSFPLFSHSQFSELFHSISELNYSHAFASLFFLPSLYLVATFKLIHIFYNCTVSNFAVKKLKTFFLTYFYSIIKITFYLLFLILPSLLFFLIKTENKRLRQTLIL